MHLTIKRLLEKCYRPFVLRYLSRDRRYRYKGIDLIVRSGVFHPGLFFSTKILLEHIERVDVTAKRFLELGAGSGLVAIRAAQRGAYAVATDVSRTAVANLRENAARNGVAVEVIESDLFGNLPGRVFDVIVINPPYYPSDPSSEAERAWFCGSRFEFFTALFGNLARHVAADAVVVMSLSQDCRIETILDLARQSGLHFALVKEKRVLWEMNYVYQLC